MTTNCVNSSTFIDYVCALWAMQLLLFFTVPCFFPLLERIFEELVIIKAEDGRCYFCNLLKTQICIWGFALYKNMQLYLIKLVSGARLDFRIVYFQRCGMWVGCYITYKCVCGFFFWFFFFKLSFHLTFLTMHSVGMSIKPSSGVMRCSCAVTLGLFLPLSAQEGDFRALRN